MPLLKSHPIALLTGAGFTANFGGFLADQMWEKILNQPVVYESESLRHKMLHIEHRLNFENLYSYLRQENGSDLKPFLEALEFTYKQLDVIVQENAKTPAKSQIDLNILSIWFRNFQPMNRDFTGYIFTLNQDLFLERMQHRETPYLPGAPDELQCGKVASTDSIKKVKLPEKVDYDTLCTSLQPLSINLIKLHGSCNWLSSDGQNAIAIGAEKSDLIEREPLLRNYLKLFKEVIVSGKIQLWIIGYGFGDKHINEILIEGIDKGTRICVINPVLPKHFFKELHFNSAGEGIRYGISAYVSNSLRGLFPLNHSTQSQPLKSINDLMASHLGR